MVTIKFWIQLVLDLVIWSTPKFFIRKFSQLIFMTDFDGLINSFQH